MYESIIEAVTDAYEGEDPWAYENEVINWTMRIANNDIHKHIHTC